ncbi:hypothetical protein THO17_32980 [Marinomonas sp. THO17]
MENSVNDPYQTPTADVEVNIGDSKLSSVYKRFSAWGVVGLMIITLGFYGIYWLVNRTNKINAYIENPISVSLMVLTCIFAVLSTVPTFFVVFSIYAPFIIEVAMLENVFSIVYLVLFYAWLFKFRNRIHSYVNAQKGTYAWAGPILTFFLSTLYLQYKINKIIDNE